jgi:hypothetical protein
LSMIKFLGSNIARPSCVTSTTNNVNRWNYKSRKPAELCPPAELRHTYIMLAGIIHGPVKSRAECLSDD